MFKLVRGCGTFFRGEGPSRLVLLIIGLVLAVGIAHGQSDRKVQITFLPPPLDNATYSLGIYDTKSGKLVRRLQEIVPESAFAVGLNGLIASWDGKDDTGKLVPAGHYSARGYAVGMWKVEGVDILGNDWAKDDQTLRVKKVEAITLVPEDEGLAVLSYLGGTQWKLLRFAGAENRLLWQTDVGIALGGSVSENHGWHCSLQVVGENVLVDIDGQVAQYRVRDGTFSGTPEHFAPVDPTFASTSAGKDDTSWRIEAESLSQYSAHGDLLRHLTPQNDEPVPVVVAASTHTERLYVLEKGENWQRVRGLSWVGTKMESGKQVSTWQTFFERNIYSPDPALGLRKPVVPIEVSLIENPLNPGKPQKVKLGADCDNQGSYVTTADGLRLRRISQRADLDPVRLIKDKTVNRLEFYQSDGAAWDEFSIEGAKNMMEFDAGEFEMTADGEKTHTGKPAEPPDL